MQASAFAILFLTLGCLLSSYTDAADSAEEGKDGEDGEDGDDGDDGYCGDGKKPVVLKSTSYGCQDALPGWKKGSKPEHCGMFPASNIFESGIERAIGKVAKTGKPMYNIWLTPNKKKGPETGFTLDLGCVKKAEGVSLKNTHNRQYRDRATKKFKLLGSPTSAEGPWKTLLEANLEDSSQQKPPPIKQLMFENPQNVRFIKFELLEFFAFGGGLQYFEVLAKDDAGQEQLTPVAASMSSTYTSSSGINYKAELCINGKDNGKDQDKKNPDMCHSKQDPVPWIALDFGEEMQVSVGKVVIVNRIDCCHARTKNLEVRLTNELPADGKSLFTGGLLLGTFDGPGTRGQKIEIEAEEVWGLMSGRYLLVQMDHTESKEGKGDSLNLKEVTAFGKEWKEKSLCDKEKK